jgi:hypothetical protein
VVDLQRRSKKRDGRKEGVKGRERLCVLARILRMHVGEVDMGMGS